MEETLSWYICCLYILLLPALYGRSCFEFYVSLLKGPVGPAGTEGRQGEKGAKVRQIPLFKKAPEQPNNMIVICIAA